MSYEEKHMSMDPLDRVMTAAGNIAKSLKGVPPDENDARFCARCGGLARYHGIYGTARHVPDLDKLLEGYQVATAECDAFSPEE